MEIQEVGVRSTVPTGPMCRYHAPQHGPYWSGGKNQILHFSYPEIDESKEVYLNRYVCSDLFYQTSTRTLTT
jgi:hypothetical protein